MQPGLRRQRAAARADLAGAFIDAARHWTDRGVGFEGPLGDNVLNLPTGPTFAVLREGRFGLAGQRQERGAEVQGLQAEQGRPADVPVRDRRRERGGLPQRGRQRQGAGLQASFTLKATKAPENLYFRAAAGNTVEVLKGGWFKVSLGDNVSYRVKLDGNGKTFLRKSGGKTELMYQPAFKEGKATLTQEIVW